MAYYFSFSLENYVLMVYGGGKQERSFSKSAGGSFFRWHFTLLLSMNTVTVVQIVWKEASNFLPKAIQLTSPKWLHKPFTVTRTALHNVCESESEGKIEVKGKRREIAGMES